MYKIFKYKNDDNMICKDEVVWIPMDPSNTDYREYLQWCSEGNEAEIVDLTGDDNE